MAVIIVIVIIDNIMKRFLGNIFFISIRKRLKKKGVLNEESFV